MLIPRRVKHRKQHHPKRSGQATGGTKVSFGEYGIQALTPAYVTNRQIESARIAMTRHIKRGGKVWINIYPDRPLTKKPAETRMGSGKGSPEWWVANVKPGRVLFEARRCERRGRSRGTDPCNSQAAPQGTHHQARGGRRIMAIGSKEPVRRSLDTFENERLADELKKAKEELFNLRFQSATGQLESHGRLRAVKRDIARIYTVLREREPRHPCHARARRDRPEGQEVVEEGREAG